MSNQVTLAALSQASNKDEAIEALMAGLNGPQREAAMQIDGPVAAIAGAGAGKTKTLIHRTAHMLVSGIPATSIMLVTFTNKGADEIKTRLQEMIGEDAQYITAGTFHSLIYRCILKQYADHAYFEEKGYNFAECSILDESEAKTLLDQAISMLPEELQDAIQEEDWEKDIAGEMARARAYGMNVEQYGRLKIGFGDPNDMLYRVTYDTWKGYEELMRSVNAIDFDGILMTALDLINADPSVGQELASRFGYLMLDEYQDTNQVQMKIMHDIAKHHQNIFVVGDEKQSIYRFRGADVSVIIGFKKRYPTARIVDMSINYRSTESILEAANVVAQHMSQKITEGTLTVGKSYDGKGAQVAMVEFQSDLEEAEKVAAAVRRDMAQGVLGKDIAILYRSRLAKTAIEQELVKKGIDYKIVGDVGFYQRAEVRNAISLLRMTFRPWDAMATLRMLKNTSFGVSDASAKKAMAKGQTAQSYLKEQAEKKRGNNEPTAVSQKVAPMLGAMQVIRQLVAFDEDADYIRKSVERLWETYLSGGVKRQAEKDNGSVDSALEARMQNVNFLFDRFFSELADGRKPEDILDEISMLSEGSKQQNRDTKNLVQLMTIHASKGLEFRNVYIPAADKDTSIGESEDLDDMEEERRIFYVAITRAMEKLSISYSRRKRKFGIMTDAQPSPFLMELSRGLGRNLFKYRATTAPTLEK